MVTLAALLTNPLRAATQAPVEAPLVVIVSPQTGLQDLKSSLLRRAYQGFPTEYARGKKLVALNQPPGSAARERFDKALLGFTPAEMGRFWVDQRIRGVSQPPRSIATPELTVRVVATLIGAVSYVSPSQVNSAVRVVTVDGKRPSDGDYLLR
jgi:hypothetical protein